MVSAEETVVRSLTAEEILVIIEHSILRQVPRASGFP